jgi:general secretion pathway protein G
MQTALGAFNVDYDRYPTSAEGLVALVTRPANIPEAPWHGPYLEKVPHDPWGHEYVYHSPGMHNTNRFDLYSLGPDGRSKSGGDDADDINNWSKGVSLR